MGRDPRLSRIEKYLCGGDSPNNLTQTIIMFLLYYISMLVSFTTLDPSRGDLVPLQAWRYRVKMLFV